MRRGENIYRRKDGRWEGRYICGKNSDGKSLYRSVYGHSYNEVRSKMKETAPYSATKKYGTISEVADSWLSSMKLKNKLSTYTSYKSLYKNHISSEIGSVRVEWLNSSHLERLLEDNEKLSAKTKGDILTVIKQILKYAESNGYYINSSIKTVSVHQEQKPVRVFTPQERKILNDYLLNNRNLRKIGIYFCWKTGIRIGELCALQRKNIDFENSVLHINATLQRLENPDGKPKTIIVITEPKSKSSIRDIPIPDYLIDIIKEWYYNMEPEQYLLTGKKKYMEPRTIREHYSNYIRECGISDVKFHTLRHDFATRSLELGMDIKTLSEILGHSDVSITLSRYVHPSIEIKRINMNKLSVSI